MMMHMSRSSMPYDPTVEEELDEWEKAKANKDYSSADSIRAGLRERGVSPAKERSARGVEGEMQQWQRAREAKDYARSDRLRDSLRAQGCEPDQHNGGGPQFFAAAPMMQQMFQTPINVVRPQSKSLSSMSKKMTSELQRWYEAKDEKNFGVADQIREGLRAKGIEPDQCPRPDSAGLDDYTMDDVRQWYEAKDSNNFGVADTIRAALRAKGIEPSECQRPPPAGRQKSYGAVGGGSSRASPYGGSAAGAFDSATEQQLDEWLVAKQSKDFSTADAIRTELRAQGIEPDKHRK